MPTRSPATTATAVRLTFQLKNPWGFDEPAPLTWDDLSAYCRWLAVADASQSAATGPQPAGALNPDLVRGGIADGCQRALRAQRGMLADIATRGNFPVMDSTLDARIHALELVLAMSGR